MSEHGHDSHDTHAHDAHAPADHGHGHDDHAGHGHDDHGHGDDHGGGHDGHGEHWGDYNSQPPAPSTLPAIPAWGLGVMGVVLAVVLGFIVCESMELGARAEGGEAHGGHAAAPESHDEHGEKKAPH